MSAAELASDPLSRLRLEVLSHRVASVWAGMIVLGISDAAAFIVSVLGSLFMSVPSPTVLPMPLLFAAAALAYMAVHKQESKWMRVWMLFRVSFYCTALAVFGISLVQVVLNLNLPLPWGPFPLMWVCACYLVAQLLPLAFAVHRGVSADRLMRTMERAKAAAADSDADSTPTEDPMGPEELSAELRSYTHADESGDTLSRSEKGFLWSAGVWAGLFVAACLFELLVDSWVLPETAVAAAPMTTLFVLLFVPMGYVVVTGVLRLDGSPTFVYIFVGLTFLYTIIAFVLMLWRAIYGFAVLHATALLTSCGVVVMCLVAAGSVVWVALLVFAMPVSRRLYHRRQRNDTLKAFLPEGMYADVPEDTGGLMQGEPLA